MISITSRKLIHEKSDGAVRYRSVLSKSPVKSMSPIDERKSLSSMNVSKVKSELSIFQGLSKADLSSSLYKLAKDLFTAKCTDLSIIPVAEQERRFFIAFKDNASKRTLNLKENKLGKESLKILGKLLIRCKHFAFINLSKNRLSDGGVKKIAKSLLTNWELVHLDISSTDLSAAGSAEVLDLLSKHQSLHSLDISSHQFLYRNKLGPSESLTGIMRHPTLTLVNFSGTNLGNEGMKYLILGLENNKVLNTLGLSNNSIKGNVIKEFFQVLVSTNVTEVDLSYNLIEEVAADEIAYFFNGIYGYSALTKIVLSHNLITAGPAYSIFESLVRENYLESLNLENNNFTGYLDILNRFLAGNRRLKYLNLNSCSLKVEAFCHLCDGLCKNESLQVLKVAGNHFKDTGAEQLAKALSQNTSLKKIDISSNKIRSLGGLAITSSLRTNKSIKIFIATDNEMKDDVGESFYYVFSTNFSLNKLLLQLNPMSTKYINDIEKYIERNKAQQHKEEMLKMRTSNEKVLMGKILAEEIKQKMLENQIEKRLIEGKISGHAKKLAMIKSEEDEKLEELKNELRNYKEQSSLLSQSLHNIQSEMRVLDK